MEIKTALILFLLLSFLFFVLHVDDRKNDNEISKLKKIVEAKRDELR